MKTGHWIALLAIVFLIGYAFGESKTATDTVVRERIDTVVVRDTVSFPVPDPVNVYIVRIDTVAVFDTVYVTVPITQQTYVTDSYRAVIEGYKPKLLELELYPQTFYITKEKEVIRMVKKTWQPFISGSYSTFDIVGVGGGTFYNNLGLSYEYQYSLRERMNGHQFSLKLKF